MRQALKVTLCPSDLFLLKMIMNFLRLPSTVQTFLLAWACSSWAKASLLLPYRHGRRAFRQQLNSDERRSISFYHLLVAYIILRWFNSRTPLLTPPHPPPRHPPPLRPLLFLTIFSTLIDELFHLRLLQLHSRSYLFVHSTARLVGRPAPPTSTSTDCCICLGTLLPASPSSSDSEDDGRDALESFCRIPHHVAHRACMRRWVLARPSDPRMLVLGPGGMTLVGGRAEPTCPMCRGEFVATVVMGEPRKAIIGKRRRARRWARDVARFVVWRDVATRWVVTIACVTAFWGWKWWKAGKARRIRGEVVKLRA